MAAGAAAGGGAGIWLQAPSSTASASGVYLRIVMCPMAPFQDAKPDRLLCRFCGGKARAPGHGWETIVWHVRCKIAHLLPDFPVLPLRSLCLLCGIGVAMRLFPGSPARLRSEKAAMLAVKWRVAVAAIRWGCAGATIHGLVKIFAPQATKVEDFWGIASSMRAWLQPFLKEY
jgi:hypothetical protein